MLKFHKHQELNHLEVAEAVVHTVVVTEKEVILVEVEIEVEADLLEVLLQEEKHLVEEEEAVEEAQALLKEGLMLLQKEKEETKLSSFLQENLLNSKAQNKQHLQSLYFQI